MTKTNAEIITFMNAANGYLKAREKAADHKLKYALRKVVAACMKAYEAFSEASEDLRIEHCSVDPKNATILRDERGGYVFTKDALRAFNKGSKALSSQDVEITPFIATAMPDDLTDDEREAFAGFVLPELVDEPVAAGAGQ